MDGNSINESMKARVNKTRSGDYSEKPTQRKSAGLKTRYGSGVSAKIGAAIIAVKSECADRVSAVWYGCLGKRINTDAESERSLRALDGTGA